MQFRVNQKVEVRSTQESGFHRSWKRATIVDSSNQSYHVRYDNILLQLEDGAEKLVEVVPSTPTRTVSSSQLRPLPPLMSFGAFDLPYGLFVDVYVKAAWWEGVIFDHENVSNERVVLLLESGEEIKTKIESLRISQDWNVFTGVWKPKGTWPLIGLFEGCEKDRSVLDGTDVIVDAVRSHEYPLIDHEGDGVVMNSDDAVLASSDKDSCSRLDMVSDCEKKDVVDSGGALEGVSKVLFTSKNPANRRGYTMIDDSNGEGLLGPNGKKLGKRRRKPGQKGSRWVPAGPDLLPVAEFCPAAITRYASHGNQRPPEPLVIDVRKHLAYVGWKIECMKYGSAYKFRYISPRDRKTYFSLRLLCLDMRDPKIENSSLISPDLIDVKESPGRDHPRNRKRMDELSQFPPEADSQGGNDEVGSLGDYELRHLQGQNASRPKPRREKVIENLKKLKDSQKSNQELNASPLKQRRGKAIETLKKQRDGQRRQSSETAMQEVTPRSSKRQPRSVLSWMIDNNLVSLGANVSYRRSKARSALTRGKITRDGIECNCCQKIFTLTGFESHAGSTKHRPAANILLEDGRSLLDCQRKNEHRSKTQRVTREAKWKGRQHQHQHQGETDYICSVCHDGGDLIVCDQCPSTFHQNCVGLEDIPEGQWFCPPCCCGICGENKFKHKVQEPEDACVLSCDQCELKYHIGCLRNKGVLKLERKDPKDSWFCSNKCEDIFLGLQKLLGKPVVVGPDNLTWTLWKSMESDNRNAEISTGKHSKLDLAVEVIHECFEPAIETYTGRYIAEDVIFSRGCNLNRLNFRGFYTVLLERNDELITVANVRVFGDKVAEMPLAGTRFQFRRLGMCKILMNELEKQLMNLGVERLMLPAVPSMLDTWINGFGFSKLTDAEKMQYLDRIFLDFPSTIKCQKVLLKTPPEGTKPG
ncbi:unnamed protein product [Dovyalis caffra]|uniref:PHD finger transcription factor n=1 Tax=Dovyalis caffra TaxID=77055 RepID=A0AAV1S820_9ROSI|nr:unnamed protein product [Dovyalis caffra]